MSTRRVNNALDPRLVVTRPWTWNATLTRDSDQVWRFQPLKQEGTTFVRGTISPWGQVHAGSVVAITLINRSKLFGDQNYIDGTPAGQYVATGGTARTYYKELTEDSSGPVLWIYAEAARIHGVGIYTADDWERMLTLYEQGRLEYPYFDGSDYPS
ncbi:hypothetical protein [Bifidobacterium cuniculi]|uniref:Uncharacterized protein n=1 Tax=Bifidobacterium cuniculi TaxID=1688 RepID=A0A087B4D3_9BIFI|nr:hypothetical protein [Bifidobacterium cuniculi]KFI65883.1 hypothetical protein BCUN_0379 [Bifidobacterium cuniculi]